MKGNEKRKKKRKEMKTGGKKKEKKEKVPTQGIEPITIESVENS